MGESWQAFWHKQVSAPSREAWDGPADVPGASCVLLPFARTLFSLSIQGLFYSSSSSSSGAMWDATIKLNSLKKTEPTPRAQGSGKRHTVFTQVLSAGPQSITVILPALQQPSDSSNHDILLLWLLCMVAVNTHGKHNQSSVSQ